MKSILNLAGALFVGLGLVPVHAQTPPGTLPGSAQPGQIERDLRVPPAPRALPNGAIVPTPSHKAPAGAEAIRFTVRDIALAGNTRYADADLRTEFASLVGQEMSLADLYAIADRITTRYRNDGYILSQAIVPAQQIDNGTAHIEIVEGFINDVRIEGEVTGQRAIVEDYAAKIRATRPLHAKALERYLLLMNDLAGVTARATLVPAGAQFGAADLIITLSQRVVTGSVSLDNRGGKFLGPWRFYADLDLNSLARRFDKTAIRAVSSFDERLNYASVAHEQPIGGEGARLGLLLGHSRAEPRLDGALASTNIESSATSVALTYTQPLVRSRSANLYARASLGAHDGETRLLDQTTAKDKLRFVRGGLTYDLADAWRGINLVDVEVSQGLDVLGARETGSTDLSRVDGRSDFTKGTLYAARLQSIAAGWSVLAAMSAQHAAHALLASELFGFGGAQFGRGYDPSELVGDSGIAGKIELRYNGSLPTTLPMQYTAYSFYDVGRVWRRRAINEPESESGASYGLGLRIEVARNFSGFGELAKPATRKVRAEDDRDLRGYVGVAYKF